MKRSRKSGRMHFNKIVKALSEIYEISYKVTLYYYRKFGEDVKLTKMHLKRIYNTGLELETIN